MTKILSILLAFLVLFSFPTKAFADTPKWRLLYTDWGTCQQSKFTFESSGTPTVSTDGMIAIGYTTEASCDKTAVSGVRDTSGGLQAALVGAYKLFPFLDFDGDGIADDEDSDIDGDGDPNATDPNDYNPDITSNNPPDDDSNDGDGNGDNDNPPPPGSCPPGYTGTPPACVFTPPPPPPDKCPAGFTGTPPNCKKDNKCPEGKEWDEASQSCKDKKEDDSPLVCEPLWNSEKNEEKGFTLAKLATTLITILPSSPDSVRLPTIIANFGGAGSLAGNLGLELYSGVWQYLGIIAFVKFYKLIPGKMS